jgi:hypothetical protein
MLSAEAEPDRMRGHKKGCPGDYRRAADATDERPATTRASMSWDVKRGPALWLDGRLVARVVSGETVAEVLDRSKVTPEDPIPQWQKDAMVFVDAVNRTAPPSATEPLVDAVLAVKGTPSSSEWYRIAALAASRRR